MAARPAKAGKALPGVVAEVVDQQGNKMPPNKGGLLVIRKPFPHMFRTVYGDRRVMRRTGAKFPTLTPPATSRCAIRMAISP